METLLGKKIQAKVIDENDQFYFAQAEDGLTYRIDKSEIKKPLKRIVISAGSLTKMLTTNVK